MPSEIFDPSVTSTSREFGLGSILWDVNKAYIYIQAGAALAVGKLCLVEPDGESILSTTAKTGPCGFPQVAIANDSYGWLQVAGPCTSIDTAGTVTVNARLFAAAGEVTGTDADVSITGVGIAARTGAGITTGMLMFPSAVSNT